MRFAIVLFAFATTTAVCLAVDSDVIRLDDALNRHLLLYAIRPEYPYEMRHRGVTGTGDFLLRFDYDTGHLEEIHIVKSTGSPMLDKYTIDSLKHWKAKPRSIHRLLVPLGFTTGGWRR
jgi:TonB family protein